LKITDTQLIKAKERELIRSITRDLDWRMIRNIFREKHQLELGDSVTYKHGDMVVRNSDIAYQLDFEVKVSLSVILDRAGNYLSCATSAYVPEPASVVEENTVETPTSESPTADPSLEPRENISEMASQLASMISEINEA
jgi:hypothetical protein